VVRPVWAPGEIGPAEPNTARVRDYWLGGNHHTAADRELADEFVVCAPHLPYLCRIQRQFLRRAVRYLVDAGMRQFLDLGSGLPTVGNVHEVAQEFAPDARVVYVDLDPVVAEEGRNLLAGTTGTDFIRGDLRCPGQIIEAARLLDFDRPVAVLIIDVLHFVRDGDDPAGVIAGYIERMVPGSHVAMTHTSKDEGLLAAIKLFSSMYGPPPDLTFRDLDRIGEFYAGLDLVEPGLVPIPLWRPEPDSADDRYPEEFRGYAGVGRKP
jgi:hypothetical protein